jgi:hypothetical protein
MIDLLEEGRVLRFTFVEPWTLIELTSYHPRIRAILGASPYRIHTLVDLRNIRTLAPNVLSARYGSLSLAHPNNGEIVFVGPNHLFGTMAEALFRLRHYQKARFMSELEPTLLYLHETVAREHPIDAGIAG